VGTEEEAVLLLLPYGILAGCILLGNIQLDLDSNLHSADCMILLMLNTPLTNHPKLQWYSEHSHLARNPNQSDFVNESMLQGLWEVSRCRMWMTRGL
jgi:hypothetical protein